MAGDRSSSSYCITWTNFDKILSHNFCDYLHSKKYCDVTLSAEGKFLSVHKIILAASSKYFEEMFDVTTERQLIVLSGVKFEDLENIVEYMYKGQVNVSSENLEIFKSTAGLLQIKGFTKGSSRIHSNIEPEISRYGSKETPQTSASSMKTSIATPSQAVKPEPSSPPFLYQLNEIAELSALKETQKESDKDSSSEQDVDSPANEENAKWQRQKPSSLKFSCKHCKKFYKFSYIKKHQQNCKRNPERQFFECAICKQKFPGSENLLSHMAAHIIDVQL